MVADWRDGYGEALNSAWNPPGMVFWGAPTTRWAVQTVAPERDEIRMIPNRDIWRAANLLMNEHGADAEVASAR